LVSSNPPRKQNPQEIIMPSTVKQVETTAHEAVHATPFTRVHGRPKRKDYETLKDEASVLASEVEDITYAWSRDATKEYGLLANILGFDEYDELTGIDTYAISAEPALYDPAVTNATPTHERKHCEEEWELVRTSWFIRKGILRGVVDNLRDALDEQYYSQLKHRLMAYRNVTSFQILNHLNDRWCPLDVQAKKELKKITTPNGTPINTSPRLESASTTTNAPLSDRTSPSPTTTNSNFSWRKSTTATASTSWKC